MYEEVSESDMDFMGGETNEYGEWEETEQTIYEAQKREMIKFLSGLEGHELKAIEDVVKANPGRDISRSDIEYALMLYRDKRNSQPAVVSAKDQLDTASSLSEKQKALEGAGLYTNPRTHYFEGKPLPVSDIETVQRKSARFMNQTQPVEKQYPPKIGPSKGVSHIPVPPARKPEQVGPGRLHIGRKLD